MFRPTGVMLCVHSAERWLSGRKHRFAKPARGKPLRGFESLSLRHSFFLPLKFSQSKWIFSIPLVGNGGRVRRPPYPLRPARCRCRVRVGGLAGLSSACGPVGMRAAEIRGVFPLFCGKTPSHFRSPSPGAEPVRIRAGMSHPGVCRSSNGTGRDATLRAAFSPPNPSLAGLLLCR